MKSFIKRNNISLRSVATPLTLAFMLVGGLPAAAGQQEDSVVTARDVFERLQTEPLELLKKTTRLDMLDYWDADSVYKATNVMNGLSWLETVTPDYLKVCVTPVSTLEIKVLPDKKGSVVMTLYTVGGNTQAADTQVSFYTPELVQLDTKRYFTAPALKDFFDIPKGSATTMKEIQEMIPFPTVSYSAGADNDDLKATLTVGEYMNVDDYNIVKLFLKPEVTLKWSGKYK
jgi:hypothetical protein